MKFRGTFLFAALLALSALFAAAWPDATPPGDKESTILRTMIRNLERFHYEPVKIDDDFSRRMYQFYLNDLDGARLFFTQKDLDAFAEHETTIDDQIATGSYAFFEDVQERWTANLDRAEQWYTGILEEPFDITSGKEITMVDDDSDWVTNDKQLRQYWYDYMKRDVINQVADKISTYEKAVENRAAMTAEERAAAEADDTLVEKSVAELEAEAREKLRERYDDWFGRMRKSKLSIRRSQYLNALTAMFDPHTSYYRPKDKESFDIRFSGRLEGIGATLQNKDQYTRVATLVVGGPAWKGKELEVDDLIMAVRQQGEEEAVDIKDMLVEDVVGFIRGDKGTTVYLKIKKPDGTIKEISIVRDVIVIDERFAKSLILDGKGEDEKIGYINLPSFYADFQNEDGRFSAKDVKAELEKLKDREVDGIILDLRNNGGGSLRDVVDMTGFFIPEGPIVQVAGRGGRKEVLRDKDPSVVYDGPVVVLVNQYSASASEILAAALQDYNRAVIVGSTQTFGKGTVQRFIDMDRTVAGRNDIKPLGTVKLTMQKFYRVNGGSTQLEGVTPDIFLPDSYAYLETGERENDYPLQFDKIEPARYDRVPEYTASLNEVREQSLERTNKSEAFQAIDKYARDLRAERDETLVSLNLDDYVAEQEVRSAESDKYKDLFEPIETFDVDNLDLDKLQLKTADESKKERNQDFIDRVKKDLHLYETVQIVNDMIDADERKLAERE